LDISKYQILVKNRDTGDIVIKKILSAGNNCGSQTCNFTPVISLSGTNLKWAVRAKNIIGWGKYSDMLFFSLP
ncbi:MAG: hypothetical protein N2D54_05870, partial [Chloroflexota bacterium]